MDADQTQASAASPRTAGAVNAANNADSTKDENFGNAN
jgi:hypothetical protein